VVLQRHVPETSKTDDFGNELESESPAQMVKKLSILAIAAGISLAVGTVWMAGAADDAGSAAAAHAVALIMLTWCLTSLRIRRRNGRLEIGFELSPVHRVRALSTVHGVKRGTTN
jgi:hypothetical protein